MSHRVTSGSRTNTLASPNATTDPISRRAFIGTGGQSTFTQPVLPYEGETRIACKARILYLKKRFVIMLWVTLVHRRTTHTIARAGGAGRRSKYEGIFLRPVQ